MFINPDLATQLARDHQRQLLAQATQRQPHQHRRPAPSSPGPATRIIRNLAAAITRARVAAAQTPSAI